MRLVPAANWSSVQLAGGGAGGSTFMDSTVRIMDLGWALNAPNGRVSAALAILSCFLLLGS